MASRGFIFGQQPAPEKKPAKGADFDPSSTDRIQEIHLLYVYNMTYCVLFLMFAYGNYKKEKWGEGDGLKQTLMAMTIISMIYSSYKMMTGLWKISQLGVGDLATSHYVHLAYHTLTTVTNIMTLLILTRDKLKWGDVDSIYTLAQVFTYLLMSVTTGLIGYKFYTAIFHEDKGVLGKYSKSKEYVNKTKAELAKEKYEKEAELRSIIQKSQQEQAKFEESERERRHKERIRSLERQKEENKYIETNKSIDDDFSVETGTDGGESVEGESVVSDKTGTYFSPSVTTTMFGRRTTPNVLPGGVSQEPQRVGFAFKNKFKKNSLNKSTFFNKYKR